MACAPGESEAARRALDRGVEQAVASKGRAAIVRARLAQATALRDPAAAAPALADIAREAEALGDALLRIRAAEALGEAELARGRAKRGRGIHPPRAEGGRGLRVGAGLYRLHALLGRVLDKEGAMAAADEYRESARHIAKVRDGLDPDLRRSFAEIRAVQEVEAWVSSHPGAWSRRLTAAHQGNRARPMESDRRDPGTGLDAVREITQEMARISSENARLLQRLGEGEKRFRLISKGILRVQEAERGRISRELHDGVGQSLTALKIQLQLLEASAAREESALSPAWRSCASSRTARCRKCGRSPTSCARKCWTTWVSCPPSSGWSAPSRANGHRGRARGGRDRRADGPRCGDARLSPGPGSLDERREARRGAHGPGPPPSHGRAAEPEGRGQRRGFDVDEFLLSTDEERGFGLRGIRDRVHLFAGRFTVTSHPGAGTTLDVEVPLEPEGGARG
jgi:signal transduction histidine kinase